MKKLVVICAACGVGKTTVIHALNESGLLEKYIGIDTDEVGVNWWDYEGTEHESKFSDDCLAAAVKLSSDNNLVFSTCMNPLDFYGKVNVSEAITSTYFIALICSDEEIRNRLKARPKERMCGSDEFISGQIEYNAWFRKNANKFQLCVDNTGSTEEETAGEIAEFIKMLG